MKFDLKNLEEIVDHFLEDELEHLELCIFEDTGGDLVNFDFMDSTESVRFIENKYPRHTSNIAYNLLKLDVEIQNEKSKNVMP